MKVLLKSPQEYQVILNELISVDHQDRFMSSVSKWEAHSNEYLRKQDALPHRAFSIFFFNQQNKLLMQKRSTQKKTFPLCWTNTCCSHPNMVNLHENNQKGQEPIRNALHRALIRQLQMDIPNQQFYFMQKILYKKEGAKGQKYGQYEVDYVFLGKISDEVKYSPVPEEIADLAWISQQQMPNFIQKVIKDGGYLSPWFLKMHQSNRLTKWWQRVEQNKLIDIEGEDNFKVTNML